MKLVIVESPGKIKKIQGYLGSNYIVKASIGHVQDLNPRRMSIDIVESAEDQGYTFIPHFEITSDKRKVVSNLRSVLSRVDEVILAADKDREGEMIAYSLAQVLDLESPTRITFNEITKKALHEALANPGVIDMDMVNAQKTRRLMDRLVGYEISPLLGTGLSAGRVQSVVVRLIVEKEKEISQAIENLDSTSRFKVDAVFINSETSDKIACKLIPSITSKDTTRQHLLLLAHNDIRETYVINNVVEKPTFKQPPKPFITSVLQQEASHRLRMNSKKTMEVAQKLYEKGLITYMRTDSANLCDEAISTICDYIDKTFGCDYICKRSHKNSKSAQEAHEAIRPTDISITDESIIENNTTAEEARLYQIIWRRTIASQMKAAEYLQQDIKIKPTRTFPEIEKYAFESTCKVLIFDGFLKIYRDDEDNNENNINELIKYSKGTPVIMKKLKATQEFVFNKTRYSEPLLVKKLESLGIGRPSTFASIISTIQNRKYVEVKNITGIPKDITQIDVKLTQEPTLQEKSKQIKVGGEKARFVPTQVGIKVTDFMVDKFHDLMEFKFTSEMEKTLDDIAKGNMNWQDALNNIYDKFHKNVIKIKSTGHKLVPNGINLGQDKDGNTYLLKENDSGNYVMRMWANTDAVDFISIDSKNLKKVIEAGKKTKLLGMYSGKPVFLIDGKYGYYIKHKKKNYRAGPKTTFEIAKTRIRAGK
uniref:DNA topoisomerase n=1 Tax=Megaviridae environmental sample TaxID=1737588 RepID=A0A5J6VJ36_9VIRU|nr:MAG: DNA topoisomerase [Megaviridae environmental sample]